MDIKYGAGSISKREHTAHTMGVSVKITTSLLVRIVNTLLIPKTTKNSFFGVLAFEASLVAISTRTPDSSIEIHPYARPYNSKRIEYGSIASGCPRIPSHTVEIDKQEDKNRVRTHRGGTDA